jgi:hypothetical protein
VSGAEEIDGIEEIEEIDRMERTDGIEEIEEIEEIDRMERTDGIEEIEEIDAIPVLVPEPSRALVSSVAPTVRTAAVAAGGFVAGAAVVGLVHRRGRQSSTPSKRHRAGRGLGRGGRGSRTAGRAGELVQIVGSRSLLVDVHLLGGGGDR